MLCRVSLCQVLPVPAAEGRRGLGSPALLLRHPHGAGLLHGAVRTGRLRPRRPGQRLHQRAALRAQPDQRAGGEGHGAPQDLQVGLRVVSKMILVIRVLQYSAFY